jgi:hypothetical protein
LVDLNGGTTGQVLTKASDTDLDFSFTTPAGSPITTEGDLIIGDASGDAVRLPIGSAGTVLTSDGDTADWAAPAGVSQTWTLINTGGTALTGAATITISGISDVNDILVIFTGASSNSAATAFLRLNADSGTNYTFAGNTDIGGASYDPNNIRNSSGIGVTQFTLATMSSDVAAVMAGSVYISNCNSTSYKIVRVNGAGNAPQFSQNALFNNQGFYEGTSAISSVSIVASVGNWDAGTIYVYGA